MRLSSYLPRCLSYPTQRNARLDQGKTLKDFYEAQARHRKETEERQNAFISRQNAELTARLEQFKSARSSEEKKVLSDWEMVNRARQQTIERVIKMEEDKVRAKLEAERRVREEEEAKKRKAEEEKRRIEEEQKRKADEKKRKDEDEKKRKEEEDARLKREEESKKAEEEEIQRAEAEREQKRKAEEDQRGALGMTTPEDDFKEARNNLNVSVRSVCSQPSLIYISVIDAKDLFHVGRQRESRAEELVG